ncbi:MAG: transcription antitermination factor NusB [Coriobacteriia bacterium]|nr:transcription antitermination factor NusB [Coriobacteriia bacterium]
MSASSSTAENRGMLSYAHARTRSRVFALRLLYQQEMTGVNLDTILAERSYRFGIDRLQECLYECDRRKSCERYQFFAFFDTEPDAYALTLVRGVNERHRELDRLIREASEHWAMFRMPVVDRCLLRLSVWEVCYNDDIPAEVAINEAVQLAKEYGGEDSPKFINGLLGKVARSDAEPVE